MLFTAMFPSMVEGLAVSTFCCDSLCFFPVTQKGKAGFDPKIFVEILGRQNIAQTALEMRTFAVEHPNTILAKLTSLGEIQLHVCHSVFVLLPCRQCRREMWEFLERMWEPWIIPPVGFCEKSPLCSYIFTKDLRGSPQPSFVQFLFVLFLYH